MISHKWINNKCECGCERIGTGKQTRHTKDMVTAKYIECTRVATSPYHKRQKEKYKMSRCLNLGKLRKIAILMERL